MNANGAIVNRRHDLRYLVKGDVRVILGGVEGEILDICRGGLGVRFNIDDRVCLEHEDTIMAIDMDSAEFYLTGIPVKEITHCALEDEFSTGEKTKRCGIIFGDLRPMQLFKIDYLVWLAGMDPTRHTEMESGMIEREAAQFF